MTYRDILALTCLCGWSVLPCAAEDAAPAPQQQPQQQAPKLDLSGGQKGPDGENADVRLLGMEVPLLDPANDTVAYNGGLFDVGNNAVVRARFEKYLYQTPEDSKEMQHYMKKLDSVLKLTQKSARSKTAVGSETLLNIGRSLYELGEYPDDGGQSPALAGGIAGALSVQYANRKRDRQNAATQKEIDKLVEDTNRMTNHNTGRGTRQVGVKGDKVSATTATTNTVKIAQGTKNIGLKEAGMVKNDADSVAATEMSKLNYQSMLISFLMERRFDHVVIGARTFRHIFRDGDSQLKLEENSKVSKMFTNLTGTTPTVDSLASLASNMRYEVDKNMQSVEAQLAQNRLSAATQHLIEAVAVGEYMQSVAAFPLEKRGRIAEFWSLRKRALTALNARDYGTAEDVAKRMKEMDVEFDDSLLRSYCAGRKQQSDLALRNAVKALKSGNEEEFNKYITEAGTIWPLNPKLAEGREQLERIDSQDGVLDEFKVLIERGDYRTIYNEQDKFEVVALNPELKVQYKEAITVISTIDGMLKQLDSAAAQDATMGPCMAYEMLLEQQSNEGYEKDARFRDALARYALAAHDFVQALEQAEACEKRGELGSALANYYRAQCLYPRSEKAGKGVKRLTERILKAKY